MGYRSEVGFACYPIIKKVINTVAEWDKEFKTLMEDGEDLSNDDHGRWRFEDVKWYQSFPDVQVIENIMGMCENTNQNYLCYGSYGFVRIGEEYEDIELKGDPSAFDLYVHRSIDI